MWKPHIALVDGLWTVNHHRYSGVWMASGTALFQADHWCAMRNAARRGQP